MVRIAVCIPPQPKLSTLFEIFRTRPNLRIITSHEKIINRNFVFRYARQLMEETIRRNASPVREGSERERMGGSSSSLNSSASDESNRLNQPGFALFVVKISYIILKSTLL